MVFHEKWGVPLAAYLESMNDSLTASAVPRWYVMLGGNGEIIGGLGVIENDFHDRPDLRPNVCAVYVEPEHRCKGIAGRLLERVCDDMAALGEPVLYLLTDHDSFYEHYGWEFYCMATGDGEETPSRMYVHKNTDKPSVFVDKAVNQIITAAESAMGEKPRCKATD